MLLRSLHIASRQLFYLLVFAIIVGLLALLGAVWLSDEIAKRKDEIAGWVSQETGYPVEIGSAGMYWLDLIPKLEVQNVRLLQKDADVAVITASNMQVSLDIVASIQQGQPVVSAASISGAELSVNRGGDGVFRLSGLEQREISAIPLPRLTRWLSWFRTLELNDIDLAYSDQLQPAMSGQYRLTESELSIDGNRWQASAGIELPSTLGQAFRFTGSAEFSDTFQLQAWQWQASADNLDLAALTEGGDLYGILLQQGTASLTINAGQQANGESRADLTLDLREALLSSNRQDQATTQVNVDRLQGYLDLHRQPDQWQLTGHDLQISIGGEAWPLTRFEVERDQSGVLTATANYLRLSDITAISLLLSEPSPLLAGARPAGDINGFQLSYLPGTGFQHIAFEANEMALLPWQDYPGANNLSFTVDWSDDGGRLDLNSQKTTLFADTWLPESAYFESVSGSLHWSYLEGGWRISSEQLSLWNDDLSLQLDGYFEQQQGHRDSDVTLQLQDVVVNRWLSYVPQRILDPAFRDWSAQAFRDGVISDGKLVMKGDPAAFPFDQQPAEGTFLMKLQVEDAQLHYAEGWPELTAVKAEISGSGNDLLISSQSGAIAGFAFSKVKTTIDNLVRPNPMLKVEGLLSGSTPAALAFLQQSPLKQRFGRVAEWLQAEGQSDIELALTIPLADVDATQVKGSVSFKDSMVTLSELPQLPISQVNGLLQFDNDGVSAKDIQAQALGESVTIDVEPRQGFTLVEIDGRAALTELDKRWPGIVPRFAQGSLAYRTSLSISEPEAGRYQFKVDIGSDLDGISLDLPAPLGKTADESRTLSISMEEDDGGAMVYRVAYDALINAALRLIDDDPRGQIMLGGAQAVASDEAFTIAGEIESLSLVDWLDWQAAQAETDTALGQYIDSVDVHIKQLALDRLNFAELALAARPGADAWRLDLSSPQVKGKISLPQDLSGSEPISIDLDYLKLYLPTTPTQAIQKQAAALWPGLSMIVSDLQVNDIAMGRLELEARRELSRWTLQKASLDAEVMRVEASGVWTRDNNGDQSQFDIRLSSDDLLALQSHFGYQQVIEAERSELISKLSWAGDPLSFSREKLAGSLDIDVGRGQLLDVQPGAAGRIFGLLSVAAIPRRLALDFSDLFGKGFDFSSIKGSFRLGQGIARTDNLVMQGESATIEVTGPIDLVNKTYDQTVRMTPKVSSTLPLAGAVAGGPVGLGVGTAILIFDKLAGTIFDREIVNLITYSYRLTGPWDAPELSTVTPEQK